MFEKDCVASSGKHPELQQLNLLLPIPPWPPHLQKRPWCTALNLVSPLPQGAKVQPVPGWNAAGAGEVRIYCV